VVAIWLWRDQTELWQLVAGLVVFAYFGVVTVIDFEHRLIMHPVSFVGVIIGLIYGTIAHGLIPTLIGGVAGFGIMLLLYFFGYLFAGFITRKRGEELDDDALGFGDVNLSGVLGLFLGWPGIILGLILAIILAGIVSLAILVFSIVSKRYKYNMTIAYGPYLIASAIVLLYFKDYIF
jgi:leader peptidase (prepilin peptidase)/N-methyltransferase